MIDVEYGTGNLNYEKVRKGVILNKNKLTEIGYSCKWSADLDMNGKINAADLANKGYYFSLQECIIAMFEKSGLPFSITIFPKSKKAKIYGDNSIPIDDFGKLRKDFDKFEEATGIHLYLKQTSEPY